MERSFFTPLQDFPDVWSKLRQRRTFVKALILSAIAVGVCCSLALIIACSHLCCDFNSKLDARLQPVLLGEGFQVSIRNLALAAQDDLRIQQRWSRLWKWRSTPQDEVNLMPYCSCNSWATLHCQTERRPAGPGSNDVGEIG